MKVIGFIGAVFAFVFFTNLAYGADMTIDMLNKDADGNKMVYSKEVAEVAVGDTITWLPASKGHNVEIIAAPEGFDIPKKSKISKEASITFDVPGARFMPLYKKKVWDGKARLFSLYNRQLYIGLLPYLKEFAETLEYDIEVNMPDISEQIDIERFTNELRLQSNEKDIEVREYQKEAITKAINTGRVLLLSPTASGKSLIIYSLIRYHQLRGRKQLIVVPTTSLVEQMYGDFADYSTKNGWRVSENCHRIYGGKEKTNEYDVTISTWQSIYKYPRAWFEQFDVFYGDEAHLFKAKSLTTLMDKCVNTPY